MVPRLFRAIGAGVRAPALHFLALGALLAALSARTTGTARATARPPIVITAARVAEIRDDYQQTLLTAPTPVELEALVAREADEEMLYREALLLGLDRGDRAVKWRIVDKMHFLYGDDAGDTETAYRRGMALGLARDDIVVRNALVTKMRLLAKAASRSEEPSGATLEGELPAYLQSHAGAYTASERLSLTQVFLSAGKRGAALEADARAVLSICCRRNKLSAGAGARLGDPFVAGRSSADVASESRPKSSAMQFATAVAELEAGRWSDPSAPPTECTSCGSPGATPEPATARCRPLARAARVPCRAARAVSRPHDGRAAPGSVSGAYSPVQRWRPCPS